MTDQYEPMAPLSREWFENLLTMVDAEGRGIPGLTVEQGMAELEPHLPLIAELEQRRAAGPVLDREKVQETLERLIAEAESAHQDDPGGTLSYYELADWLRSYIGEG